MSDEQAKRLHNAIDSAKRETLKKLAQAAWVIPAVATFAVSALTMSSNWAYGANSTSKKPPIEIASDEKKARRLL